MTRFLSSKLGLTMTESTAISPDATTSNQVSVGVGAVSPVFGVPFTTIPTVATNPGSPQVATTGLVPVNTDSATLASRPPIVLFASDELEEPLNAWLSRSEEGVTFEDLATGIFGWGYNTGEAAADFRAALREHAEVLLRQANLSPELSRQLGYLRYHLGRSLEQQ